MREGKKSVYRNREEDYSLAERFYQMDFKSNSITTLKFSLGFIGFDIYYSEVLASANPFLSFLIRKRREEVKEGTIRIIEAGIKQKGMFIAQLAKYFP